MLRSFSSALVVACGLTSFAQAAGEGLDKASDGAFTGLLLVTDDLEWYDMFQRPEVPNFPGKEHFGPGEDGSLAIIFSNAEPRDGEVRVLCDIAARDPRGSRSIAVDQVCYEGPFHGPNILHPALVDLSFAMAEDEPAGVAGFDVTLRDANSQHTVNLSVSFTQGPVP